MNLDGLTTDDTDSPNATTTLGEPYPLARVQEDVTRRAKRVPHARRKHTWDEGDGGAATHDAFVSPRRPRTPSAKKRRLDALSPVRTPSPAAPKRARHEDDSPGPSVKRARETEIASIPTSASPCEVKDVDAQSFLANLFEDLEAEEETATAAFSLSELLGSLEETPPPSSTPMEVDPDTDGSLSAAFVVCPEPVTLMDVDCIDASLDVEFELHDRMDIDVLDQGLDNTVVDIDMDDLAIDDLCSRLSTLELCDPIPMDVDVETAVEDRPPLRMLPLAPFELAPCKLALSPFKLAPFRGLPKSSLPWLDSHIHEARREQPATPVVRTNVAARSRRGPSGGRGPSLLHRRAGS